MNARAAADTSNLLIPGSVLLLLPRLVPLIGLNEAVVLQQVRFLTAPPRGVPDREGRCWVRLSYAKWQEDHFPFWKIDTVKRAFQGLEQERLLDSERTYATPRDQTKSYAINYARLGDLERAYRAATEGTTHVRAGRRRKSTDADGAIPDDQSLPASNLLLDDNPLVIIPRLAVLIGLDEALVLQQVRYWLADDRHPRFHEGRRWVRFTQQEWARQIPRSLRTLGTVFRKLESEGLLIATTRLNTIPGDQTKWYTIDFECLRALDASVAPAPPVPQGATPPPPGEPATHPVFRGATPIGKSASLHSARLRADGGQAPIGKTACPEAGDTPLGGSKNAALHQAILPPPAGNSAAPHPADKPQSIQGTETGTEINEDEIQQQEGDEQPITWAPPPHVVVANHSPGSVRNAAETSPRESKSTDTKSLVNGLIERGVTRAVAVRLAARFPERVACQTEVYDWLCEEDPDDERLTPGRLRRMIEEDWTSPKCFVPAAEQARLAAEDRAAKEERQRLRGRVREEERRRHEAPEAEYRALLASLGLRAEDQTAWRILIDTPRRLPGIFARALFYAPRDDTPPVIIFRERTDHELAMGAAYAKERAEIERRLDDRFPAYRRTRLVGRAAMYLAYDDLLAALHAPSGETVAGAGGQKAG